MAMEQTRISRILALLETISEGFAYLQRQADEAVLQAVAEGRRMVTHEIEIELGEPLARRIGADALCDAEWLGAMYRIVEQLSDPFEPANAFDKLFLTLI